MEVLHALQLGLSCDGGGNFIFSDSVAECGEVAATFHQVYRDGGTTTLDDEVKHHTCFLGESFSKEKLDGAYPSYSWNDDTYESYSDYSDTIAQGITERIPALTIHSEYLLDFEGNQECFELVGGSTVTTGSTAATTQAPSEPASPAATGFSCSICGDDFDVGAPSKQLETKDGTVYTCDTYDEQVYGTSSQATCESRAASGNTDFTQHFCECPNIIECRLCPAGENVGTPQDIIVFEGGSWNATCAQIEMDFLYFTDVACQDATSRAELSELCECSSVVTARKGPNEAIVPLDKTSRKPLLGEKLLYASISGVAKSPTSKKLRGKGPQGDPSMGAVP